MVRASKKLIVLLIEDDPFLYKVLSKRLQEESVEVVVATDGEAALTELIRIKPVLVILDLILPKKSGFEVLAEMRKKPATADVPVVVLSNLGQQEDIDQIGKFGIREYLVKADYSLSEMVNKVMEHVWAVEKKG